MFGYEDSSEESPKSPSEPHKRLKRASERSVRPGGRVHWQASAVVAKAHNRLMRSSDRGDVPGWVLITLVTVQVITTLLFQSSFQ